MAHDITICSLNARGLTDDVKRRDVFNWMRSKNYAIYCIQEFHGRTNLENQYIAEWGGKCFFSLFTSNSRGVAILFNNNFEYTVHDCKQTVEGNILLLDISVFNHRMTIVNTNVMDLIDSFS